MPQASLLRAGMCILHEKDVWRLMSVTHRTPGNLRAFVQVRIRNLRTGNSSEHRFSSTENVERAILDTVPMEYLYSDSDGHHFMNTETYEQVAITDEILGDTLLYILPNSQPPIKVDFYEGNPVGVELPNTVTLEVKETEPSMKNATATASYKPATMQTGLIVNVPQFVGTGDRITIDTRENKYLNRA